MNTFDGRARTRRTFLKRSMLAGGALLGTATLQMLTAHSAWAGEERGPRQAGRKGNARAYGPLRPVADQNGLNVLALPEGFRYVTFGKIGEPLFNGGGIHAANLDGMTALAGPGGAIRLIRNHEMRNPPNNFALGIVGDPSTRYDGAAMGGTITIDYDPAQRRVLREFVSLNGTIVNCAGGLAYRDAGWLTNEESTAGPKNGWQKKHGYTFIVPANANASVPAVPLSAMGRFSKEAAVADFDSGIVYQTEDPGSGVGAGFYRFLPKEPARLEAGGTLQMLKVLGRPQYDAREGQIVGAQLLVEWVSIDNPDPELESGQPGCFAQGYAAGGAKFNRLEGVFRGQHGSVFFVSTSGGNAKNGDVNSDGFREGYGQLWQYLPAPQGKHEAERGAHGTLRLVYESTSGAVLDSPDNLCVTPSGSLLFCEDDASSADRDTDAAAPGIVNVNRLVGLGRDGSAFTFAANVLNDSEFAGCCYSPDGEILFVNVFGEGTRGSGMTCAITGPWRRGPL
jgi:secreted PhoX family phosphatase